MKFNLIALFLLVLISAQNVRAQTVQKVLFVSPSGDDSNPGTIELPLASFEGAQKAVREFKTQTENIPITVCFRGGKYYRTQPAVFNPLDGEIRKK
jgi:uncharacterized membrane protein YecN with MAPEG domain